MTLAFFLKTLSELSVFYVIYNCIMSVGNVKLADPIPVLVCAVAAAAAYWLDSKKPKLHFLPVLILPVVFYLFTVDFATGLGIGMIVLYTALTILGRRFYMDRETHADFFRGSIIACCICAIPFVMLMELEHVIVFILLFLISSIFLMRMLRQESEVFNNPRFRIINALSVLLVFVLALLMSSQAFLGAVLSLLGLVYRTLCLPVLYLISYLFMGVVYVVDWVIRTFFSSEGPTEDIMENLSQGLEQLKPIAGDGAAGPSDTVTMIAQGILIVIAIIFVVILVLRNKKGRLSLERSSVQEFRSTIVAYRPEEKIPADRFPPREPRAAVRYYYRSFLRLCSRLGHDFPRNSTSASIEKAVSHRFDEETLQAMRETYIRARYSEHDISKEDAASIKAQVKNLKASVSDDLKSM